MFKSFSPFCLQCFFLPDTHPVFLKYVHYLTANIHASLYSHSSPLTYVLQACLIGVMLLPSTCSFSLLFCMRCCACMQGAGSSVQDHLNKLFKALESFYHPSNYGRWNVRVKSFSQRWAVVKISALNFSFLIQDWEFEMCVLCFKREEIDSNGELAKVGELMSR